MPWHNTDIAGCRHLHNDPEEIPGRPDDPKTKELPLHLLVQPAVHWGIIHRHWNRWHPGTRYIYLPHLMKRQNVQTDVETIAAPLYNRGKQKQPVVGFAGEHCHPSFYRLATGIGIWMLFFLGVWFECLIVWVDSLKVWLNRLHNLVVRRKSKTKCLSCHLPFREFRLFIVFLWFSNSGLDFINILILSAPAMALISLVVQLLSS